MAMTTRAMQAQAALTQICNVDSSKVSLLTVEYDVRDDEPEQTEVFRFNSAAPGLLAE